MVLKKVVISFVFPESTLIFFWISVFPELLRLKENIHWTRDFYLCMQFLMMRTVYVYFFRQNVVSLHFLIFLSFYSEKITVVIIQNRSFFSFELYLITKSCPPNFFSVVGDFNYCTQYLYFVSVLFFLLRSICKKHVYFSLCTKKKTVTYFVFPYFTNKKMIFFDSRRKNEMVFLQKRKREVEIWVEAVTRAEGKKKETGGNETRGLRLQQR